MREFIAIVIALLVVLLVVDVLEPAYGYFGKVPTASVGVVTRFGKIEKKTLEPGFHVKGWFDKINSISTKTQKYGGSTSAFSADIQQVDLAVVFNYNVDKTNAPALFETTGKSYEDTLIKPRLIENVKIVIAKYSASELLENRGVLSAEINDLMKTDLVAYGINASGIAIEDIDFTDAFTSAVEAKQVATQQSLAARTEQEKLTMEAQAQAERQRIAAEAEAETSKIKADAEAYAIAAKADAEAEANKKLAASMTQELIEYTQAQNWNGQLPEIYSGSESVLPIITNAAE